MVDIDLLVTVLKRRGHTIGTVHRVAENAGEYELDVDGTVIPMEEARALLELDEAKPLRRQ